MSRNSRSRFELCVTIGITSNIRSIWDETSKRPFAFLGRCASRIGSITTVRNSNGLQQSVVIVEANPVGANCSSKHSVGISVHGYICQSIIIHRTTNGLAPTHEIVLILCSRCLGRLTTHIHCVAAILNKCGVQQLSSIIVVEEQLAYNIIVSHSNARITTIEACQFTTCQSTDMNSTADLCLVHVVAVLVQTTHGIQFVKDTLYTFVAVGTNGNTKQTHTAVCGHAHEDCKRINRTRILQTQSGHILRRGHDELGQIRLIADGQVGNGARQVQLLQNAAIGQGHARDCCVVEIHILNVGTATQIDSRCGVYIHSRVAQVGTVPHIQGTQQNIVTSVKLCQVGICVAFAAVTQLQTGQLRACGKFCIAYLQVLQIAKVGNLACRVDVDFGIVQIIHGAFQHIAVTTQCSLLYQIRAILDSSVNICIGGDSHITLGVASQGDKVFQRITGIVLTVDVAETVIQPPLSLCFLAALEHTQIRAIVLIKQRCKVLVVGILVEDNLRPHLLVILESSFYILIAKYIIRTELLVHRHQFLGVSITDVIPEHALLTRVYLCAMNKVGVLQLIAKGQFAFVVDTDCSIHIVRQPTPFAVVILSWECVLCSAIRQQEQFGEQVVEQGAFPAHPVLQFVLELFESSSLFYLTGHGISIRRCDPRHKGCKVCRVGISVRVSALKVIQPIRAAKVSRLKQSTVGGIVADFPRLIVAVKAEHIRCLIVVEIVLTDKHRTSTIVMEDNNGIAVNALSYFAVGLLGSSTVGRNIVVQLNQFHIVCAFRRGHISLEGVYIGGKVIFTKDIFCRRLSVNDKAFLELDLVILSLVTSGGCTLYIDFCASKGKALAAVVGVYIVAINRQLVALVGRQCRTHQYKIRQIARQLIEYDLTIGIKHIVVLISVHTLRGQLHFCVPVLYDLIASEVIVVQTDTVQVGGTLVRADADFHRVCLGEIIVLRVLHNTTQNAIDVDHQQMMLTLLSDNKCQMHLVIFLVLGIDFALLRFEHCFLRRDLESSITRPTGDNGSIVVKNIPCDQLNLNGLTCGTEILFKQLHGDSHSGITRYSQNSCAILVKLPTIGHKVEIAQFSIAPCAGVCLVVASAIAGQIQLKVLCFCLYLHTALCNGLCPCDIFITAADGLLQFAHNSRTIRPALLGAVNSKGGYLFAIGFQGNGCSQIGRIVHSILGHMVAILLHLFCDRIRNCDDRLGVTFHIADDVVVKHIGGQLCSTYCAIKPHSQHMVSVALCRDGVVHLSAASGNSFRADLFTIQLKVDGLLCNTHRRIREADFTSICGRYIKGRCDGNRGNGDAVINALANAFRVSYLDGNLIVAGLQIFSHILLNLALRSREGLADNTIDDDLTNTSTIIDAICIHRGISQLQHHSLASSNSKDTAVQQVLQCDGIHTTSTTASTAIAYIERLEHIGRDILALVRKVHESLIVYIATIELHSTLRHALYDAIDKFLLFLRGVVVNALDRGRSVFTRFTIHNVKRFCSIDIFNGNLMATFNFFNGDFRRKSIKI